MFGDSGRGLVYNSPENQSAGKTVQDGDPPVNKGALCQPDPRHRRGGNKIQPSSSDPTAVNNPAVTQSAVNAQVKLAISSWSVSAKLPSAIRPGTSTVRRRSSWL